MGILIAILIVFLLPAGSVGADLVFKEKIMLSQDKEILVMPRSFCVTEDGFILVVDKKPDKIKIYDPSGNFVIAWGTMGQAPGEFQAIWASDYSRPFYIVHDLRTSHLFIYKRDAPTRFDLVRELNLSKQAAINVKRIGIDNSRIFLDGLVQQGGSPYYISELDILGKFRNCYLPGPIRYGLDVGKDFRALQGQYGLEYGAVFSYFDVSGQFLYSVWEGLLQIVKINLETRKWSIFGKETENYRKPRLKWNKTQEAEPAFFSCSWICGIFADSNSVHLIYTNFDRRTSHWVFRVQQYDLQGQLASEQALPECDYPRENRYLRYFHDKESEFFYALVEEIDETGEAFFHIIKYSVKR